MATLREIIAYYLARLASIYRNKPKAAAHTSLFVKQMLADNLASALNTGFELDRAEGKQLDVIGKYIGASRDVGIVDNRPYFGFVTYEYPAGDQNLNGFTDYASLETNAQGVFFQYSFNGTSLTQLTDFSYKQLLKLKILTNSSKNTMSELQEIIASFFPGQLFLRDNKDMSITYLYSRFFQLPVSVLKAHLPRPMGVRVEAFELVSFNVSVNGVVMFNSDTPDRLIDMGDGDSPLSKIITLTNVSSTTVTIDVLTMLSSFSGVWFIGVPSPALPAVLAPGESINFTLDLDSETTIGEVTGTLQVQYTAPEGTKNFLTPVRGALGSGGFSLGFSSGFF